MPDYAKMYRRLFNSQTDAIALLQKAQQKTEEMYTDASAPDVRILEPRAPEDDGAGPEKE